jgi:hypothetical protein
LKIIKAEYESVVDANALVSKPPNKQIPTIAFIEKKIQENEIANLFRGILNVEDNEKVSIAPGTIDIPIIGKSKQKNLAALYGGESS